MREADFGLAVLPRDLKDNVRAVALRLVRDEVELGIGDMPHDLGTGHGFGDALRGAVHVIVAAREFGPELAGAGQHAAVQRAFLQFAKSLLHRIQPRGARRHEMKAKSPMSGQPALHFRGLVRAAVVQDSCRTKSCALSRFTLRKKRQKFLGPGRAVTWPMTCPVATLSAASGGFIRKPMISHVLPQTWDPG